MNGGTGPGQIVVLGMHRSGTSGVTRLLNLAGAYFGPDGIATEANEENPRGFWERRDVREVCDGLLHADGHDWWKLVGFDPEAVPAEALAHWSERFGAVLEDLDQHRPWVVKEPRLCVLLPALAPQLDAPVCVLVVREPLEVARSMHRRDGFAIPAALALWELYTVRSLQVSAGLPRVLVRHGDLLADPVATTARLVADLRDLGVSGLRDVPDDDVLGFISADLHRQRQDRTLRAGRLSAAQAALAARIDDGSVLSGRPEVSPGAFEVLELHERERARAEEVRALTERLQAEQREAAEALARAEADAKAAVAAEAAEAARQSRYRQTELARRRELGRQADVALGGIEDQVRRFDASTVGRVARNLVSLRQVLTPGASRTDAGPLDPALGDLVARRRAIEALTHQEPAPGGTSTTLFDTDNPRVRRTRPVRRRDPDRASVAVVSWDVGHNPLGRANVLAEVLARHFDVELWGAQFARYGSQIWAPMRQVPTPINVFEGTTLPAHLRTVRDVVGSIDADAVWVSKPRLPSMLVGIEAKRVRNRPVVLDVDDHELAFFATDDGLDLADLPGMAEGLDLPFERAWTRVCDGLIGEADHLTVSNVALAERYGGLVVPHARDERLFDPDRVDRDEARHRLGVAADERLLLFGGTPRAHKGVVALLEALDRLGDDRYRLAVFGTREFDELRAAVGPLERWARVLPAQPFDRLPELVAAADLACVIQDPDHPVSRYQMPAKVSDAMAMGVPCLVSPTPPLAPLIEADVLEVLEPGEDLAARIARVFDEHDEATERARRARARFCETMSYAAVAEQVVPVFERLLAAPPELSEPLVALADTAGRVRDGGLAAEPSPAEAPAPRRPRRRRTDATPVAAGSVVDVVMFWKQNDSGIYGRRQDMFVEELARSDRVGTIVHFDEPITPEALVAAYRAGRSGAADQRALVATETVARMAKRRDAPGVHRHTYLFGGRRSRRLGLPRRSGYVDWVRTVLDRHGIGDRPVVAWTYPYNPDLPALIDAIDPDLVVTDVVDDNRTWYEPGSDRADRIADNYREVLSRSDVVVANCEPVARSMEEFVEPVLVVPNGLEFPRTGPPGPRPAALAGLDGPIVAYVGNLSSRLDIDLLDAVASARPDWTFVLVGSAHLDTGALRLDRHPNVHLLGVLPYRQVRELLAHVDVGLIPHVDNEMTRSMNPLKAFVYASAGVPAVATPVANLPDVGSLLTIASGPDEFVDAIEAHLRAGRPTVDPEVLAPHTWARRVDAVFDAIDAELAGGADDSAAP